MLLLLAAAVCVAAALRPSCKHSPSLELLNT
jgi:hypothetical protein